MVVVRDQKMVFVFGFSTQSQDYDDLVVNFDSFLASFVPAVGKNAPRAAAKVRAAPPAAAAPKSSALKRFTDPGMGISIDYPGDWIFVRPSPHGVEFSGGEGTEAYFSTVSIRNVALPRAAGPDQAATSALANLKSVIAAGTSNTGFHGEGTGFLCLVRLSGPKARIGPGRATKSSALNVNGMMLQGLQFMATYSLDGKKFKKWTVIIPRPTGKVVHIWSYTSPEGQFDTYTPQAEAMRKSWVIEMDAGQ